MRSTKNESPFSENEPHDPSPSPSETPSSEPRITSTSELARRLNLSRWTVSRVLNGHDGVHPDTVRMVKEALQQYGFSASPLARGLRMGRTSIVGVCVPDIAHFYLDQKLAYLRNALEAEGFHPLISITGDDPADEVATLNRFAALRAAGVVVFASRLTPDDVVFRRIAANGIPLVRVDPRPAVRGKEVALGVARKGAMKAAVEHLWSLGHRSFLAAGLSDREKGSYSEARYAGICETLAHRKGATLLTLEFSPRVHPFYEAGQRLAEQLLALPEPRPTAVLALNDRVAIGFIHHLHRNGLQVPRDLSIIGWDNMESGAFFTPALTSVETHPDRLISQTAARLLHQIRHPGTPLPAARRVKPSLILRDSTGPAPTR